MARKNRTPEETARRAKIRELLQESNVSSMEDIQNLFRETIAEFMENGLDAELDDELGYSRYDYRNKGTENSRITVRSCPSRGSGRTGPWKASMRWYSWTRFTIMCAAKARS